VFHLLDHADQFNGITQLSRVLDVLGSDVPDTLDGKKRHFLIGIGNQIDQDADFVGSVVAVDVVRRSRSAKLFPGLPSALL